MELILTIIGILGNITAVMLFISPLPTFWEIVRKKSSGSYSGVPYACSFGNCLIWIFYGLPIVTQNNMLVITINGFGVGMETLYLLIFIPCSLGKARMKMIATIAVILIFYGVMIALTLTVLPIAKRELFVGTIAAVLNTAMYAAPLSVMKLVIQTKSVESMPFLLSLCTLINSCLWGLYGVIKKDPFIIIPNALGVIFGMMQIVLYGIYRKHGKAVATSKLVGIDDNVVDHAGTYKSNGCGSVGLVEKPRESTNHNIV